MSGIETFTLLSDVDRLPLSVCAATPEGPVRGLVQLVHGMAEHKERYLPFMEWLAAQGWASVINDHRGHGGSVRGTGDLGYFYEGGADALVKDLHQVTLWFRDRFPGLPLVLFGHSMGALAVRCFAHRYDGDIDGLIVCGSPGPNPATGFGLALNRLMTALRGERYVSRLFVGMTTGGYARRFPDPKTVNAWLSVDQGNVRAYDADPLCGFPFTLNGYRALLTLMKEAYAIVPAGHPDLPVRFISGAEDPCAPDGKGFNAAVAHMRACGYRDVSGKLYPGMRHEILNDIGREGVYADVLAMLNAMADRG